MGKCLEIEPVLKKHIAIMDKYDPKKQIGDVDKRQIQDLSKAGELGLFSAYNIIKRFTERKE